MTLRLSLLTLLLASVLPLSAAIVTHDLGSGLAYVRASDLSAELTEIETALGNKAAVILDARAATATDGEAVGFRDLLAKASAKPGVRMVLISERTSPALLGTLTRLPPGVVTLGPNTPKIAPDIIVTTSPEDDRKAYDALLAGTSFEKLINENLEKRRYDEATLVREHANGGSRTDPRAEEDADAVADPTDSPATPKAAEPPPLVDGVLRRAVQLHRALLALKRL
jgi:hypothetical protein